MTRTARALAPARTLALLRDRDVLLAFLAGIAVALLFAHPVRLDSFSAFTSALLTPRSGLGAAEILAIAVMGVLALRLRDSVVLTPADLAVIAVSSLAFPLTGRAGILIPLALVGPKLALRREPGVSSIGQILLALLFYEFIGPALFHLFSPVVLGAELEAVAVALQPLGGFIQSGLTITAPNGHSIAVEEGCSAFHNLSLAVLIWISLVKLDTSAIKPAHIVVVVVMTAATVALNTGRLAIMAQSQPAYFYWHDGPGAAVVPLIMLAAMLAICFAGLRLAADR